MSGHSSRLQSCVAKSQQRFTTWHVPEVFRCDHMPSVSPCRWAELHALLLEQNRAAVLRTGGGSTRDRGSAEVMLVALTGRDGGGSGSQEPIFAGFVASLLGGDFVRQVGCACYRRKLVTTGWAAAAGSPCWVRYMPFGAAQLGPHERWPCGWRCIGFFRGGCRCCFRALLDAIPVHTGPSAGPPSRSA